MIALAWFKKMTFNVTVSQNDKENQLKSSERLHTVASRLPCV